MYNQQQSTILYKFESLCNNSSTFFCHPHPPTGYPPIKNICTSSCSLRRSDNYFKILPTLNNWNKDIKRIKNGKLVEEDFIYSSNLNKEWMTKIELREWIKNQSKILHK